MGSDRMDLRKKIKRNLAWNRENTLKKNVPNRPGIYIFYNKKGKAIYTGHASALRHRVQSYRQVDCYKEHPTKKKLRPKIYKYKWSVMGKTKAQKIEKRVKKKAPFNVW